MKNVNDEVRRSHVIACQKKIWSNVNYNLSGADDFDSCQESESDEINSDERDNNGDVDGSYSTSTESDSHDICGSDEVDIDGYIPWFAPWFTTEDIKNYF